MHVKWWISPQFDLPTWSGGVGGGGGGGGVGCSGCCGCCCYVSL